MSPIAWALRPLKRYAQFSGRAPRAEFWWFFLFVVIFWIVISFLFGFSVTALASAEAEQSGGALGAIGLGGLLFIVLGLALLIPTIAVQVRRMHDINRTGWWIGGYYLLYLVYMVVTFGMAFSLGDGSETPTPGAMAGLAASGILALIWFAYAILLLVFMCLRGTEGDNRYGPDPYGPEDVGEVFA